MILVDQDKFKACGICGVVCPRHVLVTRKTDGKKTTFIDTVSMG